jgi:hypothetical protein
MEKLRLPSCPTKRKADWNNDTKHICEYNVNDVNCNYNDRMGSL